MYQNPSVDDFKGYFFRDFPYGTDINTSVVDADIAKAYQLTNINIVDGLFNSQSNYDIGYFLLSAHYLVMNLRSSSQGINGQYNFLEQSKGVGSVNSSYAIPQMILDNPYLSMLTKTNYGAEYLFMILPQLVGQMYTVVDSGIQNTQQLGGTFGWGPYY